MPTPKPKLATRRLGRYEILRKLATGGMAEIYLARATGIEGFQKHAVLKLMRPEFASNEHFVRMFLDEARLAAGLQHQNVGQVYEVGQEAGILFFAMEYLHGVDLRTLLQTAAQRGERIPIKHVLTIAAAVAAGLHYSHERLSSTGEPLHIVHRDVSPSNVVATYDGGVKVVDFGIARAAERSAETRTGSLKGKISYMSPEQCLGNDLDRRSDIFALGIVLYELTTVSRLFPQQDESDYVIMNRIVQGQFPAPSTGVDGYPAELDRIVMRALAIDRGQRYQTMRELQRDLEAFAAQQRMLLSSSALALYLEGVFGRPLEPWHLLDADGAADDADAAEIEISVEPGTRSASAPPRPGGAETVSHRRRPARSEDAASSHAGTTPVSSPSVAGLDGTVAPRRRRTGAIVGLVAVLACAAGGLAWMQWGRGGGSAGDAPAAPAALASSPSVDAAVAAVVQDAAVDDAAVDDAAVAAAAPPDAAAPDAAASVGRDPPAKKLPRRTKKRSVKRKPADERTTKDLIERDWD